MDDLEDLLRETLSMGSLGAPNPGQLANRVVARERRRRRLQVVAGVVGVAVAVAGIVGTAALLGTDTRGVGVGPAVSTAPSFAVVPTPPDQTQPIRLRGVEVWVPATWKVDDLQCGTPVHDTVVIEDGPSQGYCYLPQPAGLTVVRIEDLDSPLGKVRADVATVDVSVAGQRARTGTGVPATLTGRITSLVLPDERVVVSVESPDPAAAVRILSTVRLADPIRLSGLEAPTTLPADVQRHLAQAGMGYNGLSVMAADTDSATAVLYEGRDGQACLEVQQDDMGGVGSCRAITDLEHKPLFLTLRASDRNPVHLAAVLPDGYTTLTAGADRATAKSNIAYLPAIRATVASMSGPGVPTKTVDLGPDAALSTKTGLPPLPTVAVTSAAPVR